MRAGLAGPPESARRMKILRGPDFSSSPKPCVARKGTPDDALALENSGGPLSQNQQDPDLESKTRLSDTSAPSGRGSQETAEFTPSTASASAPARSPAGAPRLHPGETVAERFTILRFLARGGMGEVYEAQDLVLRTNVALKTILPHFAEDPTALERFRREVILARRASHPNVCRIYDLYSAVTASGEPLHFLTMEFLEGETLYQRLKRKGRMSPEQVRPMLQQMAAALDAAHAEGIVHRDFKTSNVMLVSRAPGQTHSGDERVVVTDFGIARAQFPAANARAAERMTGTGLLGTPEYMAPEQVTGGEAGPASDIYALGLVLYEMLTGKLPLVGATPLETAFRRVNEPPEAPRTAVPELPERWNAAVLECLERDPAKRFASASAVEAFLENPKPMLRRRLVLGVSVVGLGAVLLALASMAWFGGLYGIRKDEKWLRTEVIPELHRLVDSEHYIDAQLLAMKANAALPDNPALLAVWRTFASHVTIKTAPPGARVRFHTYEPGDAPWHELGVTPLAVWFPRGDYRVRFDLEGYRPFEGGMGTSWLNWTLPLDKVGSLPDDRVHLPEGKFGPGDEGHEAQLNDAVLDRYEVTNHRYKAFVAAGGYERPEFWREPFLKDGKELRFAEAMDVFKDRTGRPGPSTWELSSFPRGQDEFPVSGVSWYEAAAFAAFEGRDLPTVFHWQWAAGRFLARWIVPASNFDDKGPAKVGQYPGLGPFGTLDMAGNVREWCQNQGTGGVHGRFILGGGWNDPAYSFIDTAVQSPWDRSPTNGMRLISYLGTDANLQAAKQPIDVPFRDYTKEKPVGDAEFRIYRRMYAYDARPLNATVEKTDDSNDWVRQKVSFDAAYGKERVLAYLFLPKVGSPPYQTIVYFPGSNAQFQKSIEEDFPYWDFIVRSGRALLFPVYAGTLERQAELKTDVDTGSVAYRDSVIQWTQDLSRSIDYLQTRKDIDVQKLGYFGFSWGGAMGGIIPAVEPRLKAAVLHVAGLWFERPLPEADPLNFVPRVTIPVLMLNGKLDPYFPVETSQRPMFELFGTPTAQKRYVLYEAGHFVPRDALVRETLDWYDRYLGPVKNSTKATPSAGQR
jgi:eukaryotic-like serine/threonine-protein kinase